MLATGVIPGIGGGGDGPGSPGRFAQKDAKVWSSRGVEKQGAWREEREKRAKLGSRNMHTWSPGATYLMQRTLIGRSGKQRGRGICRPISGRLQTHLGFSPKEREESGESLTEAQVMCQALSE